jgi:hypothetical protein
MLAQIQHLATAAALDVTDDVRRLYTDIAIQSHRFGEGE